MNILQSHDVILTNVYCIQVDLDSLSILARIKYVTILVLLELATFYLLWFQSRKTYRVFPSLLLSTRFFAISRASLNHDAPFE